MCTQNIRIACLNTENMLACIQQQCKASKWDHEFGEDNPVWVIYLNVDRKILGSKQFFSTKKIFVKKNLAKKLNFFMEKS